MFLCNGLATCTFFLTISFCRWRRLIATLAINNNVLLTTERWTINIFQHQGCIVLFQYVVWWRASKFRLVRSFVVNEKTQFTQVTGWATDKSFGTTTKKRKSDTSSFSRKRLICVRDLCVGPNVMVMDWVLRNPFLFSTPLRSPRTLFWKFLNWGVGAVCGEKNTFWLFANAVNWRSAQNILPFVCTKVLA